MARETVRALDVCWRAYSNMEDSERGVGIRGNKWTWQKTNLSSSPDSTQHNGYMNVFKLVFFNCAIYYIMGVHISTVWGKNVSFTNLTFLASLEIDKLLWRCLQSLAFFPGLTRVTTLEGINHTNCWLIFSHTLHKISQACTSSGGKGKKRNRLGQNVLHSSNKCRVSKTEQFLTRTLFTMVFMERDKECFDQPSLSSIFTISRNCLQFCVFSPKTLFKSLSWEIQSV